MKAEIQFRHKFIIMNVFFILAKIRDLLAKNLREGGKERERERDKRYLLSFGSSV